MAALNKSFFRKNRVGCHQWVLKFKLWLAIARQTFNRFWIVPNFKLKYEDSENIKADLVKTVAFNSDQIKRRVCSFFLRHPVLKSTSASGNGGVSGRTRGGKMASMNLHPLLTHSDLFLDAAFRFSTMLESPYTLSPWSWNFRWNVTGNKGSKIHI